MKKKKYLALIFIISVIFCFGAVSVNADSINPGDVTFSPQYTYISDVSNGLTVSGKTLNVSGSTAGYFDANKCGITATLQKLSGSTWVNYKVWSATSPSSHPDYVVIGTSITVSSGQYRLVTSHSVTVGSTTEYEGMMSPIRTVY